MSAAGTVVIPTYNRSPYLRRALQALERQDAIGGFDVIVVDDGSTDDTRAVLAQPRPFPLTALTQSNRGPAAARNAAVQAAATGLIIFMDDDVIPAADFVRRHLESQADTPAAVIGLMAMPDDRRQPIWAAWEGRGLRRQYDLMSAGVFAPTPRQFFTANASVPRQALLQAGLFDESFRRAEDVELAYRLADLGLPVRFEANAVVVHDTPRTFAGWMRTAEEYGRYDILMWREKGRDHVLRNIAEERQALRAPAVRALTRMTAGRAPVMRVLRNGSGAIIAMLNRAHARRAGFVFCSGLFNALYMDAACREFGPRREFWRAIDREAASASLDAAVAGEPA